MHSLLSRQIRKCGLSADELPDESSWRLLLDKIDQCYKQSDKDRYILERSLSVSSHEMQLLYQQLKDNYQQRESAIFKVFPDLVFLIDEDGRYVEVLAGEEDKIRLPEQQVIGKNMAEVLGSDSAAFYLDHIHLALETGDIQIIEYEMHVPAGLLNFEGRIIPLERLENNRRAVLFLARDISEKVQSEQQQRLLDRVLASATEGIVIINSERRVMYANAAVARITGFTIEELMLQGKGFLRHKLDQNLCDEVCNKAYSNDHFQQEVIIHHKNGGEAHILLNMDTLRTDDGAIDYYIGILTDISEIKSTQIRYQHLATHDVLTSLPNRLLFEERMVQAVSRSVRNDKLGAILFLDLDRFKTINDSLGHGVGDKLLHQVAARLISICRTEDTVARFGGDEFVILLEDIESQYQVTQFAEKVLHVFDKKFHVQDNQFNISTSIGISLFPEHGADVEQLVKQADVAMYEAKNSGRNQYQMFAAEYLESTLSGLMLEHEMQKALDKNQFLMMYQPQYVIKSRRLSGFEALIRWKHPEHGMISPAEFIPVAESSGFIDQIGLWVFKQICEKVVAWSESEFSFGRISFNLSLRQLMDPHLADKLIRIMEQTGALQFGTSIECEITESLIIKQVDVALNTLNRLKEVGLSLAIDDFGTGHSSLVNLKRYPLDRLKIDREFVRDIGKDKNDEAIIRATIALAKGFDLEVIAEGVEEESQLEFLQEVGCEQVQGFLFNRPLAVAQCESLLESIRESDQLVHVSIIS
jgi:diguanylate cyclase (GGDEF)-like protein/PAS domain S-box-containing protein